MAERLTVSLEDGRLEQLRTLAGGERKVGAYLSGVVSWLWKYKEDLDLDTVELSGCVILPREKVSDLLGADAQTLTQLLETLQAEQAGIQAEALQTAREATQLAHEMRAAYAELMERTVELERRLATQEDSSRNDA